MAEDIDDFTDKSESLVKTALMSRMIFSHSTFFSLLNSAFVSSSIIGLPFKHARTCTKLSRSTFTSCLMTIIDRFGSYRSLYCVRFNCWGHIYCCQLMFSFIIFLLFYHQAWREPLLQLINNKTKFTSRAMGMDNTR